MMRVLRITHAPLERLRRRASTSSTESLTKLSRQSSPECLLEASSPSSSVGPFIRITNISSGCGGGTNADRGSTGGILHLRSSVARAARRRSGISFSGGVGPMCKRHLFTVAAGVSLAIAATLALLWATQSGQFYSYYTRRHQYDIWIVRGR